MSCRWNTRLNSTDLWNFRWKDRWADSDDRQHNTRQGNQDSRRRPQRPVRDSGRHAVLRGPCRALVQRGDYPEPSRKQDEWRYTPIERIDEFFTVFEPSGETQIEVSMIDGSPLAEGVNLQPEQARERPVRAPFPSPTIACPQSNGTPAAPNRILRTAGEISPARCSLRCTARGGPRRFPSGDRRRRQAPTLTSS